jgi:hypothetical protein
MKNNGNLYIVQSACVRLQRNRTYRFLYRIDALADSARLSGTALSSDKHLKDGPASMACPTVLSKSPTIYYDFSNLRLPLASRKSAKATDPSRC